ncbi:MAG TPA: iron ABC transporter permease [Bacillales bacterium]|nr:iron ABC transporter permease [Bacillales bacterium]
MAVLGTESTTSIDQKQVKSRPFIALLVFTGGLVLLALGMGISISVGAADISLTTVWNALFHFQPDMTSHLIVRDLRIPRVLGAAIAGDFLAISGAVMQGMTRNPLAAPSIIGIVDGATFAIAMAFVFFPDTSYSGLLLASFLGSALSVILVYAIGSASRGGLTPVKLALAGVTVGALFRAISMILALHFNVGRDITFWFAGGVSGLKWEDLDFLFPIAIACIPASLILSRSITILSLGQDVAVGLGQRTVVTQLIGTILVLFMTGAAVSVAGAISFIGLVVPHITRFIVGMDYRYVIPCSMVLGAALVVYADILSRVMNPPSITPVGAITALLGVPFFIYLVRKEGRAL